MFPTNPNRTALIASPLFELDGHEFVIAPGRDGLMCRNCGQTGGEAQLVAAVAAGRKGVFTECAQTRKALAQRKLKDLCLLCHRELSRTYLDLYLGWDPVEKNLCRDCREKRAKTQMELFGMAG